LAERGRKAILALNKIDVMAPEKLLALADRFRQIGAYSDIFMISATTGSGVDDLKAALAAAMPPGPFLYPPDQAADIPLRLMAAEITREKLYLRLHDELPYETAIETESWEEGPRAVTVNQVIYVARESQRPIVLGKGGRSIKAIGQAAREDLQEMLGRKVNLFLHVKVRENWAEQRAFYAPFGLDYES
jgi:GTP-binding protein Era